jgi:hypothetical protein
MTDISDELGSESKGFSSSEYNLVARRASLESINLLNSRFDVLMESFAAQNAWKLNYGRKVLSCHYSEEDLSVAGIFQYFVTAKHGRKRALHCVADYAVFYEVPANSTEEAAKGYCHNVGTFAAYPYFRALFAQLVAGAGLSLPPLPAIASVAHIPPRKGKEE